MSFVSRLPNGRFAELEPNLEMSNDLAYILGVLIGDGCANLSKLFLVLNAR